MYYTEVPVCALISWRVWLLDLHYYVHDAAHYLWFLYMQAGLSEKRIREALTNGIIVLPISGRQTYVLGDAGAVAMRY